MLHLVRYKRLTITAVLAAGVMDTCSGLLLMFYPAIALMLMGVSLPSADALVLIRFIGAFVFSVGGLYFLTAQRSVLSRDLHGFTLLLAATAWVRSIIFIFTSVAILSGGLSWAWWSVPFTDGLLAVLQWIYIRQIRSARGGYGNAFG